MLSTPSHTLGDEDFEKLMELARSENGYKTHIPIHTMVFRAQGYTLKVYSVKDIESCVDNSTSCGEYGRFPASRALLSHMMERWR